MAVDMGQVRAALEPEEPDYAAAAKLGPDALPHLAALIDGSDASLAAKAAYLAGMIGGDASAAAVAKAARSSQPTVRVAAAAAARHLSATESEPVLLNLVDDADPGVQKVALRSIPEGASDVLRSRAIAVTRSLTMPAEKARAPKAKRGAKRTARAVKRVAKAAKKSAKTARGAKKTTKKAAKKKVAKKKASKKR
jgi:hypothetical protein